MFTGLDRARQQFADRNPGSRQYFEEASRYLPGGHTRTVLTHPPFPLAFVSGQGATLTDVDGHTYIDLLGDYTAGLLGHSEPRAVLLRAAPEHSSRAVARRPARVCEGAIHRPPVLSA